MKKFILLFGILPLLFVSCQKEEENLNQNTEVNQSSSLRETAYSFITAHYSGTGSTTFNIYDGCANLLGSVTTLGVGHAGHILFDTQTSTTIKVIGSSSTSYTFSYGTTYYIIPSGCSSGNYILEVSFKNDNVNNHAFHLNTCTWSADPNGVPDVIDEWDKVCCFPCE